MTTVLLLIALLLTLAGLVAALVHVVANDGYGTVPPPRSHPQDGSD